MKQIKKIHLCPMAFSLKDTHHRQMAQTIEWWSTHGTLIVEIDAQSILRPFEGTRVCTARTSFEHALTCSYRPLPELRGVLIESFDLPGRECINLLLQMFPQDKFDRSWIRRPRRLWNRPLQSYPPLWIYHTFHRVRWSWNHYLCLSSPGRRAWYRWAVSLSDGR
jgi:hypothetical protein